MAETTPDRARLRALCEQADRGPWCAGLLTVEGGRHVQFGAVLNRPMSFVPNPANAEFIAAANPQTVLALLDQLDQQAETIQRLETENESLRERARAANHARNQMASELTTQRLGTAAYEEELASLRQRLTPQEGT